MMHGSGDDKDAGCGGGCQNCRLDPPPADAPRGGRLVAMSVVGFLGPLILAIAGAVAAPRLWSHDTAQLLGGLAGLAAGFALAALARRLWRGAEGVTPA